MSVSNVHSFMSNVINPVDGGCFDMTHRRIKHKCGKKRVQLMCSLYNNTYGPIRGTERVTGKCLEECIKNEKFESVQCAERKIWRSEFSYKQVGHRGALKAAETLPAGR